MTRLDRVLVYAESHRLAVCGMAAVMIASIAWADWKLPPVTIGYLYVLPVLLSAAALSGVQILILAVGCAILRELFDPAGVSAGRLLVVTIGFAMTGLRYGGSSYR